jgi:hypothetical protein
MDGMVDGVVQRLTFLVSAEKNFWSFLECRGRTLTVFVFPSLGGDAFGMNKMSTTNSLALIERIAALMPNCVDLDVGALIPHALTKRAHITDPKYLDTDCSKWTHLEFSFFSYSGAPLVVNSTLTNLRSLRVICDGPIECIQQNPLIRSLNLDFVNVESVLLSSATFEHVTKVR